MISFRNSIKYAILGSRPGYAFAGLMNRARMIFVILAVLSLGPSHVNWWTIGFLTGAFVADYTWQYIGANSQPNVMIY